ncbi:MAG: PKD domain-containing protein [Caldilineaceae bacterium]|nr:PKD domain-containing protein [Caldilineaceae bacterium]
MPSDFPSTKQRGLHQLVSLSRLLLGGTIAAMLALALWVALVPFTPTVRAVDCAVPGTFATVQAAVNDLTCTTVNIAAGTFTNTVTITRSVTLNGAGQGVTALGGEPDRRVLSISGAGVEVRVNNLSVVNGNASNALPTLGNSGMIHLGGGAAVYDGATLWLENVTLNNNVAHGLDGGSGMGGAIGVYTATLHATDVIVHGNVADTGTGNGFGGGVAVIDGAAYITRTQFFENYGNALGPGNGRGGAIYLGINNTNPVPQNATLSIVESSIYSNSASEAEGVAIGGGLGIVGELNANVFLRDNEWHNNAALGSGATVGYGLGGAIGVALPITSSVNLMIADNIFNRNVANTANGVAGLSEAQGGAIYLGADAADRLAATLINNTFYENVAQLSSGPATVGQGGALRTNNAEVNINSSLIYSNVAALSGNGQGGAIRLQNSALTLDGSILRDNVANNGAAIYSANDPGAAGQVNVTNSWIVDNYGVWTIRLNHNNPALNSSFRHVTLVGSPGNSLLGLEVLAGNVGITNTIIASHTLGISNTGGVVAEANNLFAYNGVNISGTVSSSNPVIGEPRFVNPRTRDYHIQTASDAVDHGIALGVLTDIDGDARDGAPDVGADELNDTITGLGISGPATATVGIAAAFSAQISTGTDVNYSWSFDDGGGGNTQSVNHTFMTTGPHEVTVTAANILGSLTATKTVEVVEAPPPITGLTAGNDGPTEVNSATHFTAAVTGGTDISYIWDFGDGNSGSGIAPTHTYAPSGVYTATVTASSAVNSLTATTTVYVGDAVVDVIDNSFDPVDATIPAGGKVVWVLRQGFHSVTADDGSFNQPAGSNWTPFIHTFDTVNTYPYYCTVHGGPGGVGMAGSVIVEEVEPTQGLTASNDGPTQVNHPTNFTAAVTGGTGITYSWEFGDGSDGSGIAPTHTYAQSGVYTATVVATNAVNTLTATTTVYIGDAVVEVFNNRYEPADVTIPAGGKVVWVLREGTHSVTADDGSFEQPAGSNWPPFIHSFDAADTYDYHCSVHGLSMAGSVIVQGSSSQPEMLLPTIRKNN